MYNIYSNSGDSQFFLTKKFLVFVIQIPRTAKVIYTVFAGDYGIEQKKSVFLI